MLRLQATALKNVTPFHWSYFEDHKNNSCVSFRVKLRHLRVSSAPASVLQQAVARRLTRRMTRPGSLLCSPLTSLTCSAVSPGIIWSSTTALKVKITTITKIITNNNITTSLPSSPAHHAGVVTGVAVARTGNVKPGLGSVNQEVSPHTGRKEKVGEL